MSALLDAIIEVAREGDEDDVLDAIYGKVDERLRAGAFDEVDEMLARVDPEEWPTIHCLAFLSITRAAKDKLRNRERYAGILYLTLRHRPDKQKLVEGLA